MLIQEITLKKALLFTILLGVLVLTTAFAADEQSEDKKDSSEPTTVLTGPPKSPDQMAGDFVIGPGDTLHIFVWKEPDLSKDVPVRPDGKISLPLVNDVQASGLSAMQLKNTLEEKLSKFINDPNVTVTVQTVTSHKVILMGEVTLPGPRPLAGPMRVMDILATTGFTPFSKTTKVYVLRNEDGKQQKFAFNYKDYLKGKNPEQNILLKNGDTIVVP